MGYVNALFIPGGAKAKADSPARFIVDEYIERERLAKLGFVSNFDLLTVDNARNLVAVAEAFDKVLSERANNGRKNKNSYRR